MMIRSEADFRSFHPVIDKDIRLSYRGGYTYANPKYQGQIVREAMSMM